MICISWGPPSSKLQASCLSHLSHFQLGWASVDPNTPIKIGERFCVCVQELFTWILSPLEILYINDTTKFCKDLPQLQKGTSRLSKSVSVKDNFKGAFKFGSGTL
eukprot:c18336_g1_i3 orf=166-480(+)